MHARTAAGFFKLIGGSYNHRVAACRRLTLGLLTGVLVAAAAAAADRLPPVLLSRQIMAQAQLQVGDTVAFSTERAGARVMRFRVAGVYEPTPDPMKFNVPRHEARFHLPDLMALTAGDPADPQAAESVTTINVKLNDASAATGFAADVAARGAGLVARATVSPNAGNPFTVLERFHLAIAVVTVAGSTAFLLALMVIRAEERREIVGMLRLIGVSRRSIVLEVLLEGLVVAVGGAILGVAIAALAQYGINLFFQVRYDTTLVFVRVTPAIALRCLAVALPIGIVTGAAAAWMLVRQPPAGLVRR